MYDSKGKFFTWKMKMQDRSHFYIPEASTHAGQKAAFIGGCCVTGGREGFSGTVKRKAAAFARSGTDPGQQPRPERTTHTRSSFIPIPCHRLHPHMPRLVHLHRTVAPSRTHLFRRVAQGPMPPPPPPPCLPSKLTITWNPLNPFPFFPSL